MTVEKPGMFRRLLRLESINRTSFGQSLKGLGIFIFVFVGVLFVTGMLGFLVTLVWRSAERFLHHF